MQTSIMKYISMLTWHIQTLNLIVKLRRKSITKLFSHYKCDAMVTVYVALQKIFPLYIHLSAFCVKVHCVAQFVTLESAWTKCIHITVNCLSIMTHCINNYINIKSRSNTTWQFRIKDRLFVWEWQIQISHIYFMLSVWSYYIRCLKTPMYASQEE